MWKFCSTIVIVLWLSVIFAAPSFADWADVLGFSSSESELLERIFDDQTALYNFIKQYSLSTSTLRSILNDSEMSLALVSLANGEVLSAFSGEQEHGTASSSALQRLLDLLTGTSSSSSSSLSSTSSSRIQNTSYSYTALNCKSYTIVYLADQEAYISPNFKKTEYFIAPAYIERYIDTKNPGNCSIKSSYDTHQTFDNRSELRYIAPNGKIYYTDPIQDKRNSPEMNGSPMFPSLAALRARIQYANPQIAITYT